MKPVSSYQLQGPEPAMVHLARAIFRPLSRLFLRHGMNYHELKAVLGWSLVQTAMNDPDFAIPGRGVYKYSISHAAARTGMTRREATQFASSDEPEIQPITERTRRAMRVLSAWKTTPGYQDDHGEPLELPLRGPAPSFEHLAEKDRRDVPARAIADVLVAEGNAEWTEQRHLKMVSSVNLGKNLDQKDMLILGQIAGDFMHSLQHALSDDEQLQPRLREAYFNDVSVERAGELREQLHAEITRFNSTMNKLISEYRAEPGQPRMRVGVGSYSYFGVPETGF